MKFPINKHGLHFSFLFYFIFRGWWSTIVNKPCTLSRFHKEKTPFEFAIQKRVQTERYTENRKRRTNFVEKETSRKPPPSNAEGEQVLSLHIRIPVLLQQKDFIFDRFSSPYSIQFLNKFHYFYVGIDHLVLDSTGYSLDWRVIKYMLRLVAIRIKICNNLRFFFFFQKGVDDFALNWWDWCFNQKGLLIFDLGLCGLGEIFDWQW